MITVAIMKCQADFRDVAFMLVFALHFQKLCLRLRSSDGYMPRNRNRGKQGHAVCKKLLLRHILCLVTIEFHGDYKTFMELGKSGDPMVFWDIAGFKAVVFVYL